MADVTEKALLELMKAVIETMEARDPGFLDELRTNPRLPVAAASNPPADLIGVILNDIAGRSKSG